VDKSVEVAATEKFNARRITLMAVREPSVIAVKYGYRGTFRGDVPTNPAPTASGNPIVSLRGSICRAFGHVPQAL
jgi:hypothetical protein